MFNCKNQDYKMNTFNRYAVESIATDLLSLNEPRAIIARTKGQYNGFATRRFSPSDLGGVVKPFIFLDAFKVKPSGRSMNDGWHPHSGISTVTYLLKGSMRYKESTGVEGVLPTGGVEYMQAGNGVWHTGGSAGEEAEGFQLWLSLPASAENGESRSQYLEPSQVKSVGPVKIILGHYQGVESEAKIESDLTYLHISLKAGETWEFKPESGHDVAWIAMHRGLAEVSGKVIGDGEVIVFEDSDQSISFTAIDDTDFILGAAVKHPHALVMGYYSVHTDQEALHKGENNIIQLAQKLQEEGILPTRR